MTKKIGTGKVKGAASVEKTKAAKQVDKAAKTGKAGAVRAELKITSKNKDDMKARAREEADKVLENTNLTAKQKAVLKRALDMTIDGAAVED